MGRNKDLQIRIDSLSTAILEIVDIFDFEIDGAMLAIRDKNSGSGTVIYLNKPAKNSKKKKKHYHN